MKPKEPYGIIYKWTQWNIQKIWFWSHVSWNHWSLLVCVLMGLDLQFLVIRRIHSHSPGVTVKKRRDISCLPLDGPRSSSCRSVLAELGSHPNWGTSHIYPCTHPSTYPSTYLSISLSLSLSLYTVYNISIYLYLVLSFFLSLFLSIFLYLPIYLSTYLPTYLHIWRFPRMGVPKNDGF
jgi:hypothetical protein